MGTMYIRRGHLSEPQKKKKQVIFVSFFSVDEERVLIYLPSNVR